MQKKYIDYLSFAHFLSDIANKELIKSYKNINMFRSKKLIKEECEPVTEIDLKIEKKN